MMTKNEIGERIARLRLKKGESARGMSQVLGKNESYINHIENGKAFPSMQELFSICDYFEITPKEFFDFDSSDPKRLSDLIEEVKQLSDEQIELLSAFVKQMK